MTTKDQSWLPDEKLADTELADALALSTVPVTPSDSLKDTVLAAIDEIEPEGDSGAPATAVADAVTSTDAAVTDPDAAEPADVAAAKADLGGTGGAGEAVVPVAGALSTWAIGSFAYRSNASCSLPRRPRWSRSWPAADSSCPSCSSPPAPGPPTRRCPRSCSPQMPKASP